MKKKFFTNKQQRFCDEYLKDFNATQAAIRAGYSKKTAHVIGQENLNKPEIKNYIEKQKAILAHNCGISRDKIAKEYVKIAFSDFKDFASWKTAMTQVGFDKKSGEAIIGYDTIIDVKNSDEIDGTMVSEISRDKTGAFTFKIHDKMKALDKLCKMFGYYEDKEIKETTNNIKIDFSGLSLNELRKIANGGDPQTG